MIKKRRSIMLVGNSTSLNNNYPSNLNTSNLTNDSSQKNDIELIFNKNSKSRSIKEFLFIQDYFLNNTNIKEEFKSDYLTVMYTFEKFFQIVYIYLDTVYYAKDEKIYSVGDKQDFVYLKIKGNVGKYKIISEERTMNGLEYYLTLKHLLEEGNNNLLDLTKEANIKVYPVNFIQDLLNIEDIFFNINLNILVEKKDDTGIMSLLKNNNKEPKDVGYDAVQNGGYTFEQYYQYRSNIFPEKNSIYYNHIYSDKHKVTIFKYSLISLIKNNEFFGNFNLFDKSSKREETVIVNEKAFVIKINKLAYQQNIFSEQKVVREKEAEKIYNSSFFNSIRRMYFIKCYFPKFQMIQVNKGDSLYNEGDTLNYFYIIKDASFEVVLKNKNIFDLKNLIYKVKNLDKSLNNEFDDVLPLQNKLSMLKPYMNDKKNISIFKTEHEIFGVFEYVFNIPAIYSVISLTDNAKIYRFNTNELDGNRIKEDITLLKRAIIDEGYSKIKTFLKRLITIKNSILGKIDHDYTYNQKEKENQMLQTQIEKNQLKNKVEFITNTFNPKNGLNTYIRKSLKKISKKIIDKTLKTDSDDIKRKISSPNKKLKISINSSNLLKTMIKTAENSQIKKKEYKTIESFNLLPMINDREKSNSDIICKKENKDIGLSILEKMAKLSIKKDYLNKIKDVHNIETLGFHNNMDLNLRKNRCMHNNALSISLEPVSKFFDFNGKKYKINKKMKKLKKRDDLNKSLEHYDYNSTLSTHNEIKQIDPSINFKKYTDNNKQIKDFNYYMVKQFYDNIYKNNFYKLKK